ncbi:MAG TPA: adenosylcobinamide-GDP ribazoletransferase [Methylomirabilota bacterium]|nr:adenosylcobinamide-GDP ribazoletransferase [Methylomirabilota bacterium]
MASLILAIRFLTIVPIPGREGKGPGALGRAAWWFPAVGLGLGALLALADAGISRLFPPLVAAALVLALWKALTGGIHLDGLADCLDGLAGRDPEHRRAIMKDSRIGVFGTLGLILILIAAWSTLSDLPSGIRWRALLVAPALGRTMPLLLGDGLRKMVVRGGLGADFVSGLSRSASLLWGCVTLLLTTYLLWPGGWLAWIGSHLGCTLWCGLLVGRLRGISGDVLGSAVEVGELAFLLAVVALARSALV